MIMRTPASLKKKKDIFPDTCNKILNPREICMAQKCVFSIHYVCWGGGFSSILSL